MEVFKTEVAANKESGYKRCLAEAVDRTQQLLREEDAASDYQRICSAESMLDAAIEQSSLESERLISAQELLRELLILVALQADPVGYERHEAFKILDKLERIKI